MKVWGNAPECRAYRMAVLSPARLIAESCMLRLCHEHPTPSQSPKPSHSILRRLSAPPCKPGKHRNRPSRSRSGRRSRVYKHARGGYKFSLTKAEWRIFRYRAVQPKKGLREDDPAWLHVEVRSFGKEKWLAFFDRKTGKKKIPPNSIKPRKTGNSLQAAGGSLFSRSHREIKSSPHPSPRSKGGRRKKANANQ